MISGRFGRLDFLILNAAKAPFKPIEKLLEREIRQLGRNQLHGEYLLHSGSLAAPGGR